ncbi:MAG TPA: CDP-diacylglycerol--glycerol-3-phosphate 3-phosphatidyltransferase [Desulfobacterales bacterium]|nr:CDP-diacylglycerol--glycerol-3-phosphate 3-phosphatidyltransferase [Desulfobacterales bacterium]
MDATRDKQSFASPSETAAAAHAAEAGVRPDIWSRLLRTANHPNGLTLIRVACIPLILAAFSFPSSPFMCFLAALLFSFAAATDYLDGFLARRQGKVTFLGKAMDPVADKLLTSSAFIMLAAHGWAPAWVVCVIIGRELAVTGLRSVTAGKGIDISASRLGKLKTGFQIAAIIPLMIHYPVLGIDFDGLGRVLLWVALIFTMWSGTDYFIKFKRAV